MKYLKAKYVGTRRYEAEWDAAIKAYNQHLAGILPNLPESAQAFERHTTRSPLHDAAVLSITRCGRHDLHVDLDDRRLEFLGVTDAVIPDLDDATIWLYDELDLARKDGFELRALFDVGEFRVLAREIRVFDKRLRRYLIPDEPPPEPPTLFLDRKGAQKGKRRR